MAINRFRRILPELDPTIYSYQSQEYLPDISTLGTVSTGLQTAYDKLDYLDIPKHLTEDIPHLQAKYIQPIEAMKEQAVNSFTQGDTSKGIRNIRDIERFIRRSRQPGGVYSQLEGSYQAYQDYVSQLDKLYEKGTIGGVKRNQLPVISRSNFKGSFDEEGNYIPFSGITAVKDVELVNKALEIGKGWKANKFPAGIYRTPQGYFRADTREEVDPDEVLKGVYAGLYSDEGVVDFLQQEAQLQGVPFEKVTEFVDNRIKSAAAVVAEKEGFSATDSKFLQDWVAREKLRHSYKMKELEYDYSLTQEQMQTGLLNLTPEGGLPNVTSDGKIPGKDVSKTGTTFGIRATTPRGQARSKTEDLDIGFDQLLEDNPEYFKQYPGFEGIISSMSRGINGNDPESNQNFNKRALENYKKYKDSHISALGYEKYTDQQQERGKDTLFGKGKNSQGDIGNRSIYVIKPDKGLTKIDLQDAMKLAGAKTIEDFKDRLTIYGASLPGQPGPISGYMASVGKKKGKGYQLIFTPDNKQNEKIRTPIYEIFSTGFLPGKMESEEVEYPFPANDGSKMRMQSKKYITYDKEGNIQDVQNRIYEVIYNPILNEDGTLQYDENGNLKYNRMLEYLGDDAQQRIQQDMLLSNPYETRSLNQRMKMSPVKGGSFKVPAINSETEIETEVF